MAPSLASSKRPHEALANTASTESFNSEAQAVAVDLGMLTLTSDSREKHYMGSSSGLYFTHLLQQQSPAAEGSSPNTNRPKHPTRRQPDQDYASLYQKLRAVRYALSYTWLLIGLKESAVQRRRILFIGSLLQAPTR